MEDNKYFYEAEYKSLTGTVSSLRKQITERDEQLKQQELLMEELYKLLYYKRAWLTLSDENIRGMQKVVGKLPPGDDGYPAVMPKTSEEYKAEADAAKKPADENTDNNPWGV